MFSIKRLPTQRPQPFLHYKLVSLLFSKNFFKKIGCISTFYWKVICWKGTCNYFQRFLYMKCLILLAYVSQLTTWSRVHLRLSWELFLNIFFVCCFIYHVSLTLFNTILIIVLWFRSAHLGSLQIQYRTYLGYDNTSSIKVSTK